MRTSTGFSIDPVCWTKCWEEQLWWQFWMQHTNLYFSLWHNSSGSCQWLRFQVLCKSGFCVHLDMEWNLKLFCLKNFSTVCLQTISWFARQKVVAKFLLFSMMLFAVTVQKVRMVAAVRLGVCTWHLWNQSHRHRLHRNHSPAKLIAKLHSLSNNKCGLTNYI